MTIVLKTIILQIFINNGFSKIRIVLGNYKTLIFKRDLFIE